MMAILEGKTLNTASMAIFSTAVKSAIVMRRTRRLTTPLRRTTTPSRRYNARMLRLTTPSRRTKTPQRRTTRPPRITIDSTVCACMRISGKFDRKTVWFLDTHIVRICYIWSAHTESKGFMQKLVYAK